jgi:ABC-type Fe3+/spermidine/putrescine transport system ATPase subunit
MHGIPPRHRNIGMVFQNYALFPHLNIFDNIAYGLACTRVSRKFIESRVQQILEMIHLSGYGPRSINDLSGGEQQRVALGRALITNPELLLLDEPFSNLDARLREAMRDELRELQQELGITTILVTHDREEAMGLADNIALMHDGCIEQTGSAHDIYSSPQSFFAANFLGHINLLPAALFRQQLRGDFLKIPDMETRQIGVRPESLVLSPQENGVPARIISTAFHGKYIRYRLTLIEKSTSESECIVERPIAEHHFSPGEQVTVSLLNNAIYLL